MVKNYDDLYFGIVDEVVEELNQYKFESREKLRKKVEEMKDEFIMNADCVFDEIEDNYADEKGIEWEDDG